MHLVTGFIIATLFGKKKNKFESPLLSLKYPIQTKHLLPGRVRFQTDFLKNNVKNDQFLNDQLSKIKGVSSVQTSVVTGSVLINYSEPDIQPELLFTVLIRLLGLEKEMERIPKPAINREIKLLGKSLNRAVYERTGGIIDLWTAIPIIMGAIGIRKIWSQKALAFPTGVTLLWWAYQSLVHEK